MTLKSQNHKLSENFILKEFTHNKISVNSITSIQQLMLENMANSILQPTRSFLCSEKNTKIKIKITSGMRTVSDYHRLVKKGYSPSETSDHFYGYPVPLRNKEKIKKFGAKYVYSVGACDIIPDMNVFEAFEIICWLEGKGVIETGQIIYEKFKNTEWIHISNPYHLFYSNEFVQEFMCKYPILVSVDGGKTYERY